MRIESNKSAQYKHASFQGNKAKMVIEKLSMRDFYAKPDSSEFIALRNIYNNLWKKLGLPENLKPRLQYKAMFADMSFSIKNYMINVEKRLSPFKMDVRNKTGQNEATLRHEIEHVKQIWDIIRLLGAEKAAKKISQNNGGINFEINPSL